jgi:nucleoside-diphosphate-sugar epimerase
MNVLVTGAAGFIGSHLIAALKKRGHRVTGFVLPTDDDSFLVRERIRIFKGDVTKQEDCLRAVRGVEVIFHLAAIVNDWCGRRRMIQVNAGGTECLLRAASLMGVRRLVLMSSLAVHHFRGYQQADENAPRDAYLTPYAESKILAEDLARRYNKNLQIETVIVRPGLTPFGPRDHTSFFKLASGLEKGMYAHINGGKSVLCTAYVENLVEGIILAGEKKCAAGETFVIADQEPVRWREFIDLLCSQLGIKRIRHSVPGWLAYILAAGMEFPYKIHLVKGEPALTRYRAMVPARDFYFSSEKARRLLGYRPKVNLRTSVQRTIEWYKNEKKYYLTQGCQT